MAVLKGASIERFVNAPGADAKAVLVYGPDAGRVRELAQTLVKSVAGSLHDPFRIARLAEEQLAQDPALLADEARSLSLSGGRRVVWVSNCGSGFHNAVEIYLTDPGDDGLIVGEASALSKSAKLRMLFEQSDALRIIACYEDTVEDLRGLAVEAARAASLSIEDDALSLLVDRIGSDRALSRREIEKLLLYCHGRLQIRAEDVVAVCGDASAASLDELADAALEGDAAEVLRRFERLAGTGIPAATMLTIIAGHVARLQSLSLEVATGKARDAVIRSARPLIHFARVPRLSRQLALWRTEDLDGAARTLFAAIAQTRECPAIETPLAERTLLGLARKSQALRSQAL
jgi:DNA polymerase-3 subunit delta